MIKRILDLLISALLVISGFAAEAAVIPARVLTLSVYEGAGPDIAVGDAVPLSIALINPDAAFDPAAATSSYRLNLGFDLFPEDPARGDVRFQGDLSITRLDSPYFPENTYSSVFRGANRNGSSSEEVTYQFFYEGALTGPTIGDVLFLQLLSQIAFADYNLFIDRPGGQFYVFSARILTPLPAALPIAIASLAALVGLSAVKVRRGH